MILDIDHFKHINDTRVMLRGCSVDRGSEAITQCGTRFGSNYALGWRRIFWCSLHVRAAAAGSMVERVLRSIGSTPVVVEIIQSRLP